MRWLLLLAAGCASAAPARISNEAAPPQRTPGALRMSEAGLGPIVAKTVATEATLRAMFPGVIVKTVDLGGGSGLVFEAFDGDEKLFYVVPDDGPGEADRDQKAYSTTIFSVFATSPRVIVDGRAWRVGAPLADAAGLSFCECWGSGEVTACFQPRTHLRVVFESSCERAKEQGGAAMVGTPIGRIMWKRDPAN